jgi:rhodanese-related sulfurtransferase
METSEAVPVYAEAGVHEEQLEASRATPIAGIDPIDAWKLLETTPEAVLIDVRSSAEFLFVGHPRGAIHVPWVDEPDWTVNPEFAKQVAATVSSTRPNIPRDRVPVLLICRSGKRSLEAARVLVDEGYADLFNVNTGFEGDLDESHHRSAVNGWRFDDLPWEQC